MRRLTLEFKKPSSEREQELFERMIRSNADSTVNATEVRRSVRTRSFRIDGVSVALDRHYPAFRPVKPEIVRVAASGSEEGTSTVFMFDACRMPVTEIRLNVKGSNFSRRVKAERRQGNGWREIAAGKVSVINLPDERVRKVEISDNARVLSVNLFRRICRQNPCVIKNFIVQSVTVCVGETIDEEIMGYKRECRKLSEYSADATAKNKNNLRLILGGV